ncbi:MAG TPA: hypothetical protein PLN52_06605 [Opitutaceae bacterium]|nr:hypothetical protein [Opitutaceae bacterium]
MPLLFCRFHLPLISKVLGAFAFCAVPCMVLSAQDPFRLDRIGVVKYVATQDQQLDFYEGVLHVTGGVTWRPSRTVARPSNVQAWTLNRLLIRQDDWQAYYRLGLGALYNFDALEDGAVNVYFGDERYYTVRVSSDALRNLGSVVNLSTRLHLSLPGETATAGVIVSEGRRCVLIRAVGSGLRQFGVVDTLEDPRLTLYRGTAPVAGNDQWSMNPDNAEKIIRAEAVSGAFPLSPGASDAALVVILESGAYTVEVGAAAGSLEAGTVLIEVYSLPADFSPESAASLRSSDGN